MLRIKNANPVISFKNLRRAIGILGMLLPVICYFGGQLILDISLQQSISFYYHTNVRDVFIGLIVCVAIFLITYKGYEKIDNLISKATGLAGLCIAIFPCMLSKTDINPIGFFQLPQALSHTIHNVSAAIFFSLLAINSIWIFTLTDNKENMTDAKKVRNFLYIFCGVVILIVTACLWIINATIDPEIVAQKKIVFIAETIILEAFGISWLVKGETLFRDPKKNSMVFANQFRMHH